LTSFQKIRVIFRNVMVLLR